MTALKVLLLNACVMVTGPSFILGLDYKIPKLPDFNLKKTHPETVSQKEILDRLTELEERVEELGSIETSKSTGSQEEPAIASSDVLDAQGTRLQEVAQQVESLAKKTEDLHGMTSKVSSLERNVSHVTNELVEIKELMVDDSTREDKGSDGAGALYTRWGRKSCPSGSNLVYKGSAGGSDYRYKGGPTNTLCLPEQPEYGSYTSSFHQRGYIYGSEYETSNQLPGFNHLQDQVVPCAVCKTRVNMNILMIPGKKSCPKGWFLEYTGYLMGGSYMQAASEFLCVDGGAEPLHSGRANINGRLFYLIEGFCGSLACPPYKPYWELTCVVCSQ